jgi:hypothetical protein
MTATDPTVAPLGGEAVSPTSKLPTSPGARRVRLPALRLVAALTFLVPGGLLLLAGLACLLPWLRRLPAVLDRNSAAPGGVGRIRVTSRQPDRPDSCEPSPFFTDTLLGRHADRWRDS